MKLKSNTKGKLEKILKGTVFDSEKTFLTEILQNSYRAKAKNVYFYIEENKLKIVDDGCGLKNPESILTFDYSEWDSTDEGFGMGIWSILNIPNLEYVKMLSRKYKIEFSVEDLKENLEANVTNTENFSKGFIIELYSDYFITEYESIISTIKEVGKYLSLDIFINDEKIHQESIFNSIEGSDSDYEEYFNNRLFKAKLITDSCAYGTLKLFYEDRFVKNLYSNQYVSGIICLKKNALDLKEPDRKSIIDNDKKIKFQDKLDECIKTLYKNFTNNLNYEDENFDSLINSYDEAINYYLPVKYYSKLLFINGIPMSTENKKEAYSNEVINDNTKTSLETNVNTIKSEINTNANENNKNVITNNSNNTINDNEETIKLKEEIAISNIPNNNIDTITPFESITHYNRNKTQINIRDFIKKNKILMWVRAEEVEEYSDAISLAEYNGIKVLKTKNVLYENFFDEAGIKHISKIDCCIKKSYSFSNTFCKTNKEEDMLLLLEPIRIHYGLKEGVFRICDISSITDIRLNEKSHKKIITKNTANRIEIFGITDYNTIMLDRKALSLKKFNIKVDKNDFKIGINELKCLMYNLNTIAHELAHLLYHTVDNTPKHYQMEAMLMQEITELYINL